MYVSLKNLRKYWQSAQKAVVMVILVEAFVLRFLLTHNVLQYRLRLIVVKLS